jgi:glycosyltransferase involved in cell wall biosynthesis
MIASGIAAEKCVTIYNCVRAAGWAAPGRHGLEPWGLGDDVFVVGTVASMRPVKGIDLLLQAALACPDLPDIRWLLIGPIRDPRVQQLVDDPRLRERVRWLGYRPDARELISGADLFVMPSRQEALCVALLEAMAQGVCPVVSDAGGMREVVRDGEDGVVVPRENVAALANAIRALHADRDRVRRLAASARQRVTDFCSPARMVARALELYRRFAA